MSSKQDDKEKKLDGLFDFIEASPTAFHTVSSVKNVLKEIGGLGLKKHEAWELEEGKLYYVSTNDSSIIAFRVPEKKIHSFMIAASHSDSPALKVKPNAQIESAGLSLLNVEKYGGMLMAPWFDRPLSLAGRIIIDKSDGRLESRLVDIKRPLCVIPSLAIHMDRNVNSGHEINMQKEMLPVFADAGAKKDLLKFVTECMGLNYENDDVKVVADDLYLYDTSPACRCGADEEFILARHLDDLECVYATLKGFEQACLDMDKTDIMPILAVFDNEEVGSMSKQGADSAFLYETIARICEKLGLSKEDYSKILASSFMASCDNAHAAHPNYPEKADPVNRPKMNGGIVVKYSANQKYTTDALSKAIFHKICQAAQVDYQEFTNRSDMIGGSTLGNISNSHISLNTVDIGLAQLAMHSSMEMAGSEDLKDLITFSEKFFKTKITNLEESNYIVE